MLMMVLMMVLALMIVMMVFMMMLMALMVMLAALVMMIVLTHNDIPFFCLTMQNYDNGFATRLQKAEKSR